MHWREWAFPLHRTVLWVHVAFSPAAAQENARGEWRPHATSHDAITMIPVDSLTIRQVSLDYQTALLWATALNAQRRASGRAAARWHEPSDLAERRRSIDGDKGS
jgi:hypothetical protein